ncbi:MAG: TonB-dependent receptor [Deltaproteobacteria bacterium]|nr:TonB-dependent receptor [Deltaproteobacteria bacterium]
MTEPRSATTTALAMALTVALLVAQAATAQAQDVRRPDESPAPTPKAPQVTKAPAVISEVPAVYPEGALAAGKSAAVDLVVTIDATGAVTDVTVATPVGDGFDEAAVAAVRQYRFSPAEIDGKPAAIRIRYTLRFAPAVPAPPELPPEPPDTPPDTPPNAPPALPTGRLEGRVIEKGTREPIEAAIISVGSTGVDLFTDADGRFAADVPLGQHRLSARSSAHHDDAIEVEVRSDDIAAVTFYLRPLRVNPYETIIKGRRQETVVARRTLERETLRTVPGTFGDPLRVIESLPGVARAPFGAGLLILRGAGPRDSGVFVDGVQIPLLYHFLGGPSVFNAEIIDRLDLYPSSFPVRFGRLQGGVVEVTLRAPAAKRRSHGAVNLNLIDSSLFLDLPVGKKGRLAIGGRRSYVDLVLAIALPSDTLTVAPVYYDYQTRFDYELSRRDLLTLSVFGSDDFLKIVQNEAGEKRGADIDLNSHIGFHRIAGRWVHQLQPKVRLTLAPSLGLDLLSFTGGPTASADLTAYEWDLREEVEWTARKDLGLRFGLDLASRFTAYDANVPLPADFRTYEEVELPETQLSRLVDFYGAGVYAEATWDVTRKLRVAPGLRSDLYTYVGQMRASLDPRVTAEYQVTANNKLKGHVGLYHQNPPPEVLDRQFGQPNLDLSLTAQYGLGWLRQLGKLTTVDLQGYFIQRYDQIAFATGTRYENGEVVREYFTNQGLGRTFGAELLMRREMTRHFYGWLSYTLSYTERKRPQDKDYVPYFFDQTHNLVGVASYSFDNGWELGARMQITSGRPTTPVMGGILQSDEDRYLALRGEMFSQRLPFYTSIDVRFEKTWTFQRWRMSAFLDVRNVTNNENAELVQFDYRWREQAPVRGLPILPTLGVRGQF